MRGLTIALPKGRLFENSLRLLERAGIVVDDFSIVEEGATTPSSVAGPEADTCPR